MTDTARTELIINTLSRKGKDSVPIIKKACELAGILLDQVHLIERSSDIEKILQGIRKRSPKIVIVGSGDGTVSDVVDYLANTDIELGIVPLGTTNNFARSLGLPRDIYEAVDHISNGKARSIDLGQVQEEYFANVAGIGLSARLAQNVTPQRKRRYGRLAYAMTGLYVLRQHKPFKVQIADKDGELQFHFETHQVIVANGRFHAGKEIAAGAKLDSRELVLFKLGGPSKISFLWHMFDFYFGKRRSVYHSSYLIAKDISVTTNSPQPVELDGEVKYQTPLNIKVHPKAVKVIF